MSAVLCTKAGSIPVRVRNMSPGGALIDAPELPEVSTAVVLKRGSFQVSGRIAWTNGQKAGVAFTTNVHVADWIARQPAPPQARVDSIVSEFKAASRPGDFSAPEGESLGSRSLEDELLDLRAELAQLESSLIGDIILVATHPEIQMLDVSLQRIDRMIRQVRET